MERLHPQILHYENCRSAHERGEVIDNIHEGYEYKPCISTFMSACVSLQSKSTVKQVSTNEKCPFLDYKLGVFELSKYDEFDNIENMLEKCQTIYSYLNIIDGFLVDHHDKIEILYEDEISFLKELNLESIVLNLLDRHMKNGNSLLEKIMQMILVEVCGAEYEHPPTFSDLLTHKKIEELFDRNFLYFVRLTLAHPGGLNLRNLLWHGFISQSEDFDDRYTSLTFIIFMTILKSQKSLGPQIVSQEKVKRWKSGHSERISSRIHTFGKYCHSHHHHNEDTKKKNMSIEEIESLCRHSYFIPPDREKLIISCFREYLGDHENGHINFMYLIIPQLEHFLRRVYICSNKLNTNLLLAKSREFFTIIDNILAFEIRLTKSEDSKDSEEEEEEDKNIKKIETVEIKNNYLWKEIGIKNHHQCLDLFYLSEGLRIRDIIAHSEIHPKKILQSISERIYQVTIDLLSHFDIRREKIVKKKKTDESIITSFPIFHPKTMFFEKLEEIRKYFQNSYLKKMDFEDNVSILLKNTKEVFGYECIWTRKGFFYRKVKKKKKKDDSQQQQQKSENNNNSNQNNQKNKKKKKILPMEFSLSEVENFLDDQYENILQKSQNRGIIEQFILRRKPIISSKENEEEEEEEEEEEKEEESQNEQHPVIHYINTILKQQQLENNNNNNKIRVNHDNNNNNIIEDYDLSFEFRKKIMNNVGIARRIIEEELEIMKSLELRYDELYELVKTRKATTSKRKNFGCLTKTTRLFSKMIEILVIQTLELLISSFFDTTTIHVMKKKRKDDNQNEEEEKRKMLLSLMRKQECFYHKKLFRVMSVANRCRLDVGTGKLGKIIKELVFDQFNILKWKKNK